MKTLADSNIALVLLDKAPADPDKIKAATEFDAQNSKHLECNILEFRLTPVASDTVQQAEMCQGSNAPVPTRSNFEGSVVVFRYLDSNGKPDPSDDFAFQAMKEKGTTLHLVERAGPKHDAPGAKDQEYSYYEVLTDWPQKPTDMGGYLRYEIPLYVQKHSLYKTFDT